MGTSSLTWHFGGTVIFISPNGPRSSHWLTPPSTHTLHQDALLLPTASFLSFSNNCKSFCSVPLRVCVCVFWWYKSDLLCHGLLSALLLQQELEPEYIRMFNRELRRCALSAAAAYGLPDQFLAELFWKQYKTRREWVDAYYYFKDKY